MREIKFRRKRKDTGEWVYGFYYKKPSGQFSGMDSFSLNVTFEVVDEEGES